MSTADALHDAAGADVGSTLAKLVLPGADGAARCETQPAADLDAVAARLLACAPARVGLTGAGAPRLARRLAAPHRLFEETQAWAAGARAAVAGDADAGDGPFLLVSVGTGTSIIRVDPEGEARVGGTALGGGTLLGLGRHLSGAAGYEELARLAARGDRGRVDLRIADVYGEGGAPLPAQATASAFGRLARGSGGETARPEDLAAAVVGLVGENVGLLTMAHAGAQDMRQIVFGGSSLLGNEPLAGLLRLVCLAFGAHPHFPEEGPYLGALGARALIRAGLATQAGPTR